MSKLDRFYFRCTCGFLRGVNSASRCSYCHARVTGHEESLAHRAHRADVEPGALGDEKPPTDLKHGD